MSRENVDSFKRGLDAYNRRDLDALLETLDPDVEWHPATAAHSLRYRIHCRRWAAGDVVSRAC